MGKLSHDLHIHHFSHPHLLELTNPQAALNNTPCSACKLQAYGWMYTCKPCNFTLHTSCTQLPQLITHPAHPAHPLALLPAPAYPVGFFNCDACGQHGNGFSYHCNICEFDIHSFCASKPLSLLHHSHPCQLHLSFYPPYQTKGFSCDVCHRLGSNHWLYRCSICNFDVHLGCATTVTYTNTANITSTRQARTQCYAQPRGQSGGNPLMDAAIQGVVDGAGQQLGQNLVQSLMGGGNGDSSNGGNNSSSSSLSIVDMGSSLLSGMFDTSSY